ncbi:hypothetical protein ACQKMD_17510 [Viridibacillus sp. NPDC096237]
MEMPTHILAVGGIVEDENNNIFLVKTHLRTGFFLVGKWKLARI